MLEIIHFAYLEGAQGLMLSTHPRARAICKALGKDQKLRDSIQLFPLLPYAQKYVTKANEVGMVRAISEPFFESSINDRIGLGMDFLRTLILREPIDLVRSLIRLELRAFREFRFEVVFCTMQ